MMDKPGRKAPNFLIIMSDQHAPDTIGGMGHPAVKTPALDQLMATGVSFRNAYCCYPMCTPSRASFMTGQLTPEHGVWELGTPLRSDMPTWAHVLRQAGYTTSISGRMHFVGHDRMHGFERLAHPDISETLIPSAYGDWDKPQGDDHVMLAALKNAGPTQEPTRAEQFDGAVTEAAIEELSFLNSDDSDRPWALTVGLYLPHFQYVISQEYYDRYEGVDIPMPRMPPDGQTYEDMVPAQLENNRKWLGLTTDGASEDEVRMARRCYYGMITCMDEQIGRLISHLSQVGAADNTWVIYLSDHGDNMGEHGFWSKLNFYEDSVRVPLIIAPPACANPGAECETPVSLVDWMSTVLDLTGQEQVFEEMPGRSLLPLIENPAQQWTERTVLSDYACDGTRVPMRMIRRGRWKAWFALDLPPLLFDLEADPHEWNDLSREDSARPILEELHGLACSSGWDAGSLREDILLHKRRLKYIDQAESGTGNSKKRS
jgi:choline-sulfatase